jgi:hypothetical protein
MNKQLKSAVYKKRMLYNRFQKINSKKNWEAYRTQRNLVTNLKQIHKQLLCRKMHW